MINVRLLAAFVISLVSIVGCAGPHHSMTPLRTANGSGPGHSKSPSPSIAHYEHQQGQLSLGRPLR